MRSSLSPPSQSLTAFRNRGSVCEGACAGHHCGRERGEEESVFCQLGSLAAGEGGTTALQCTLTRDLSSGVMSHVQDAAYREINAEISHRTRVPSKRVLH